MMTCAQRIAAIRLIEKMERSKECVRDEDGTLKWTNQNGVVLVEAKVMEVK